MAEVLKFKFKYVNHEGREEGFLQKQGEVTQDILRLDKEELPIAAIIKAETKFKRIILYLAQNSGEILPLVLSIAKNCDDVFKRVNSALSFKRAEARMESLTNAGRGESFNAVDCVHCSSIIDLTELPNSPDVFCDYCETIQASDGTKRPTDEKFRICDQCGFFGQPREFTVFYFYFLIVIYGWREQKVHMCSTCMRKEAWKMFFGNLLFILGVPFALIQLCRVYFGGSALSQEFKELDTTNTHAKQGKLVKAEQGYKKMLLKAKSTAGIHYNLGLLYSNAGKLDEAAQSFTASLQHCINYTPAINGLIDCYQKLSRTDDLQKIKARYGMAQG